MSGLMRYWQSRWRLLLLAVLQFVGMNAWAVWVFNQNLSKGIYPVDGDSIGIPIAEIFIATALGLIVLLPGVLLPRRPVWLRGVSVLLCVPACFLNGLVGLDWWDEDHWPIAVGSALAVASLVWVMLRIGRGDKP